MNAPLLGIYGASGCGRSLMPVARQQAQVEYGNLFKLVFVDDGATDNEINGHEVMDYASFIEAASGSKRILIAVANSRVRQKLAERCKNDLVDAWTVKAESAIVMDAVTIGDGAAISPFVTLTSNITIGAHFHANLYSYVEHDCVIGDFVTFAPGVKCNGNVVIEDHAYVGAGAVIIQGTPSAPLVIGRGATVGMGAVVTRSVPAGAVVVGNPAKPLIKN